MNGIIKSIQVEKRYGFIDGHDGKSYFFHFNDFIDAAEIASIADNLDIQFDAKATSKGYKAINCRLLESSNMNKYITPDKCIYSRDSFVSGWDTIETSDYIIHASSKDSPDDAKAQLIDRTNQLGANAIVNLEYYKTTGSEPGTGKGIHNFTIHNYKGRPVVIAKRSLSGTKKIEQLVGLNGDIQSIQAAVKNRYKKFTIIKLALYFGIYILFFLKLNFSLSTGIIPALIFPTITCLFIDMFLKKKDSYEWLK